MNMIDLIRDFEKTDHMYQTDLSWKFQRVAEDLTKELDKKVEIAVAGCAVAVSVDDEYKAIYHVFDLLPYKSDQLHDTVILNYSVFLQAKEMEIIT